MKNYFLNILEVHIFFNCIKRVDENFIKNCVSHTLLEKEKRKKKKEKKKKIV